MRSSCVFLVVASKTNVKWVEIACHQDVLCQNTLSSNEILPFVPWQHNFDVRTVNCINAALQFDEYIQSFPCSEFSSPSHENKKLYYGMCLANPK